jgi:hypothetical protein
MAKEPINRIVDCRFYRFLVSVLLCFMAVACATKSANQGPDPEHIAIAKRFLHSWGAGKLAMDALQRTLQERAKDQPGMVELMRRAFADVKVEDFEDMAAQVYARHLTRENLAELTRFSESRTGNRFFRVSIAGAMEGKKPDDLIRQFSADELTEVMKFFQSDAFKALTQALPTINRELGEEGRRRGEAIMRDYVKRQ